MYPLVNFNSLDNLQQVNYQDTRFFKHLNNE